MIINGCPQFIHAVSCTLPHTSSQEMSSQLRSHTWSLQVHNPSEGAACTGLRSIKKSNIPMKCVICQYISAKHPHAHLMLTPASARPWQTLSPDLFFFDSDKWLALVDFYHKIPFTQHITHGQGSSISIISLHNIFADQGIPGELCMDNGIQFASLLSTEFCEEWGIALHTSSLQHSQVMAQLNSLLNR